MSCDKCVSLCQVCVTCEMDGDKGKTRRDNINRTDNRGQDTNVPPISCNACKPDQSNRPGSLDPGGRQRAPQRRGRKTKRIAAHSLTVFPTNKCNLNCHYCFIYEYARERGNLDMSLRTGTRAVDWLLLQTDRNEVTFHWFGGEPLVAYDLIKKVTNYGNNKTRGTNKKIRWGVTTNLTLINDDVNEFLKKNKYNVLCSIDGSKETHNMHRVYHDETGSWDNALAGLKRVLSWNPARTIRWTVAPDTAFGIADATRFYWDLGPKHVAHEFVYETEWTKDDLIQLKEQFKELIPDIVEAAVQRKRITCKPFEDGMRSFELLERMNARQRCGIGNNSYGLGTRGDLYRCHRFVDQPEHKVGDVFNGINQKTANSMVNSWNVKRLVPWTKNEMTCMRCIARMGCSGGCLAVNYDVNQSLYKPPESYCRILRMKVELASSLRQALRKVERLRWYVGHKEKPRY